MAGRWFGVRGRRFVRPTLTLLHKGAAVRALADLEHKPWAAEDGEVWTAAFNVDESLDGAREIELSVAPDIIVALRPKGKKLARPGDTLGVGTAARAPRFKDDGIAPAADSGDAAPAAETPPASPTRRRSSPDAELERLGARLASATQALEQERERRAALAKSLEDERSTNRQLRTELGQAHSELEVAGAARAEAMAVEAELEEARRQLREVQRGHEADTEALTRRHEDATQVFSREHEQLTVAHGALEDELRQQTEALESTREALAAERAESGRLRNRFAQLQEAGRRSATPAGGQDAPGEPRVSRRASSRSAGQAPAAASPETPERDAPARDRPRRRTRQREADPTETQPFDVMALQSELERAAPAPPPPRRGARHTPDPPGWTPPVADRMRPVNPSLRHRNWWFGRLLALIVLCGVIAAVYLVLHSTVLH